MTSFTFEMFVIIFIDVALEVEEINFCALRVLLTFSGHYFDEKPQNKDKPVVEQDTKRQILHVLVLKMGLVDSIGQGSLTYGHNTTLIYIIEFLFVTFFIEHFSFHFLLNIINFVVKLVIGLTKHITVVNKHIDINKTILVHIVGLQYTLFGKHKNLSVLISPINKPQ